MSGHFTHWLRLIRSTKSHALFHDLSVVFPTTDLAEHKLPLRLSSDRDQNAPLHDRFYSLSYKCDGLFGVGGHASLVEHYDICALEVLLDVRDNAGVVGSATTQEDLSNLHLARHVAVAWSTIAWAVIQFTAVTGQLGGMPSRVPLLVSLCAMVSRKTSRPLVLGGSNRKYGCAVDTRRGGAGWQCR